MNNKEAWGLVAFMIAIILIVPLLNLTGMSITLLESKSRESQNGLTLEAWMNGSYAFEGTNFTANFTAENPAGNRNCTVGYGKKAVEILKNMTFDGTYYTATATLTDDGQYLYNVTCYNGSKGIYALRYFNISNNTNISVEEPSVVLTYLNSTINVTYNYTNGTFVQAANCTIDFGTEEEMTELSDMYQYVLYFTSSGSKSYSINCSKANSSHLNYYGSIAVTDYFELSQTLTGVQYSSLAWGDVDNDNDWDLIYTGDGVSYIQKCLNNEGTLTCENSNIPEVEYGSINLGDIDNDGDLDFVYSGYDGVRNMLQSYSNFDETLIWNYTGIYRSSNSLLDINKDGIIDLAISGTNNSANTGVMTFTLLGNKTDFTKNQELIGSWKTTATPLFITNDWPYLILSGANSANTAFTDFYEDQSSSLTTITDSISNLYLTSIVVSDLDTDGKTDMILSGIMSGFPFSEKTEVYINNGTNLALNYSLTAASQASMSIGDYNNDGYIDALIIDSSATSFYSNNGNQLVSGSTMGISDFNDGSVAFFDYDNDGDLDLAISGGNNALIYNNNYNMLVANQPPSAPTSFGSEFGGTWLNLSWNNGSDDLTPELGLYYNIRVGTRPYANDIISGKYGGSSNPTQGYLGNMMQLHSYGVNVSVNRTYFYQVQTIDSGLRPGNWSALQSYDPCSYTSGEWNISVECVRFNETISVNGDINIDNGSLILINSTLIFEDANLNLINGTINVSYSNISSANANRFTINLHNNTKIHIENSNISMTNGLNVNSSNLYFSNNIISNSANGLILNGDNIEAIDSNVTSVINIGENNSIINVNSSVNTVTSGYLNVKWHVEFNVTNSSVSVNGAQITASNNTGDAVASGTTNASGYARLDLIEYVENSSTKNYYTNYSIVIIKDLYDSYSMTLNFTSNIKLDIIMNISSIPDYDEFDWSTNFTNETNLGNVENAYIGQQGIGLINFSENISVSGLNLSSLIEISQNSIYLDSSAAGINKSATLTLFNLTFEKQPEILKDERVCTDCTVVSYENYNFTFNVTGFSNYTAGSNSVLSINVTNKVNSKIVPLETVYFLVNYSNRTNGAGITGGDSGCNISFNSTNVTMAYNATSKFYEYERSFQDNQVRSYTQHYNITCKGSSLNYEDLNYSSSFDVKVNATLLDQYQSLEGVDTGTSIVVVDINNDTYNDVVYMGHDGLSMILKSYNSTGSFYTEELDTTGLRLGSIGIVDLNFQDSFRDIILIGQNASGFGKYIIIKKN